MAPFTLKHEKFEGPLDLLLTLIERRQMHISDLSLSRVTDDFLQYLKTAPAFPIAESAEFAYVAATLLLIKSKALLPALFLSEEEEQSMEELEHRLKLLKRYRELGRHIRAREGKSPLFLPQERSITPVFAPPNNLSLTMLTGALKGILAALPKTEALSKVMVRKVISLEEMIENLALRVKKALRMEFGDFVRTHTGERVTVIIGFLALLELVKQGVVAVTQEKSFGEIVMETESIETPRY